MNKVIKIPICEIFKSLQGEGARIGRQAIFVRTAMCNLRCEGFGCKYEADGQQRQGCDTYYAVDNVFKPSWNFMDGMGIIGKIEELNPEGCDIIFTGGEPFVHWRNPEYQKVLKYLVQKGNSITIETNTAVDVKLEPWHSVINFSMSVKLACSGEPADKRINIANINRLIKWGNSWFKFVVKDEADIKQIKNLLDKCAKTDVYLMPLGENRQNIKKHQDFVVNQVLENGWNYSPRLHIDLWNDERGV